MKMFYKWVLCVLMFSTGFLSAQQFKALLVIETDGFNHESIMDGTRAIKKLGEKHFFDVEIQQEANPVTFDRLEKFDVVIFLNTTGDIFNVEEQEAFEKYIGSGKGYVGIHAAADTEYDWDWYTKLVGRMFHIHPTKQTALLKIKDHKFPGLEHFPDTLLWTDEWYEFGPDKTNGLHTLITVDEASYDAEVVWKNRDMGSNGNMVDRVGHGMGEVHPISWYHEYEGGRAFYTALGHIGLNFKNQWFLDHLYGGIFYAAKANPYYLK